MTTTCVGSHYGFEGHRRYEVTSLRPVTSNPGINCKNVRPKVGYLVWARVLIRARIPIIAQGGGTKSVLYSQLS